MAQASNTQGGTRVTAYRGDAKTLLAFDLVAPLDRQRLAGFSVHVQPPAGVAPYWLWNSLQFERPQDHAQVAAEPAFSTVNAPLHKFRWVHVPGSDHQGLDPAFGTYTYTVTPRWFDAQGRMLPLDPSRSCSVGILLAPYAEGKVKLGFTRGYVQSQAFVRHFGEDARIAPADAGLLFDTGAQAGRAPKTQVPFTWADEYRWLGFTARQRIVDVLNQVRANPSARLDVFAYDLNEPDVLRALLYLGERGQVRLLLDNASLHHDAQGDKDEDQAAALFAQAAGDDAMKRGRFGRYQHHKAFIVYADEARQKPMLVLTGSTNFSVNGLYVNANHVLVFEHPGVAGAYARVFQQAWDTGAKASFASTPLAAESFRFDGEGLPPMEITFSPHPDAIARKVLGGIVQRVDAEESQLPAGKRSVLFAVMEMDLRHVNPVYECLASLHERQSVFSFGISDNPPGVVFYDVGHKHGVLVTGKAGKPVLPAPFSQVPSLGGKHEVHHKFVVCGFNGPDPVVYCGSSNLALGGEKANGDNLLAIHDADVATAFAIEALALVDHYNFLDRLATKKAGDSAPAADKRAEARAVHWYLGTNDAWAAKYFDPADSHSIDRALFAD